MRAPLRRVALFRFMSYVKEIPTPDGIDIVGGVRYFVLPDDQTWESADEATIRMPASWSSCRARERFRVVMASSASSRGFDARSPDPGPQREPVR